MDELGQIGVWVTDAHPIFLCGLVGTLRTAGIRVSGSSADVPAELDHDTTDILVFDAEAPGSVTAAACHRDEVRLVGVVRDSRSDRVMEVLAGGGAGVLVRGELTLLALVACLRAVSQGQGAVPADLLARMLNTRGGGGTGTDLATRELQVLRLLASGSTTRTIAGELCYSERTVKNIVRDLMFKLECSTRAQAVATATRQGLI